MFRLQSVFLLSLALALASACGTIGANDDRGGKNGAQPAREKPISVTEFDKLPIGHLGVPLGTVVRVTGEAIDGNTTLHKADAGKTLLSVTTVNGKKLAQPVVFEFHRAPNTVKKPAPGDKFDYYVHEYGAFDGIVTPPKELGIDKLAIANDGFYYRRYITVHAANPVAK